MAFENRFARCFFTFFLDKINVLELQTTSKFANEYPNLHKMDISLKSNEMSFQVHDLFILKSEANEAFRNLENATAW